MPDASNPPSARSQDKVRQTLDWRDKVKEKFGTINTQLMRLLHVSHHGSDIEFDGRGTATLWGIHEHAGAEHGEADEYYYFEEKAVKLNLTIRNREDKGLDDVRLLLTFPRLPGFEVADRLHVDPYGKRTALEADFMDYPVVERREQGTIVRAPLGYLAPNRPRKVFQCALRLAVNPPMRRKRLAVNYSLKAGNKRGTSRGRLKIRFG